MTEPVEPVEPAAVEAFAASRELFETALGWLQGREAGGLEHSELEARLQADAREVFRQMFQDHLDLRATREQRIEALADADQVVHLRAERGRTTGRQAAGLTARPPIRDRRGRLLPPTATPGRRQR